MILDMSLNHIVFEGQSVDMILEELVCVYMGWLLLKGLLGQPKTKIVN